MKGYLILKKKKEKKKIHPWMLEDKNKQTNNQKNTPWQHKKKKK